MRQKHDYITGGVTHRGHCVFEKISEEENWSTKEIREQRKKEVKNLMGGKFRAITQIFCVLVLALGLNLATAVPMTAAEFPSISPDTLEYDLDDPAEVITTIDWGIAEDILEVRDGENELDEGISVNDDYIVLVKHLVILNNYLEDKLTDIGDSVELIIEFDVGAASLTITAIGTQPSISPATGDYDLEDPDDVQTTITWGIASDDPDDIAITGNGHELDRGSDYTVGDTVAGEATLTIQNDYLEDELTDIGDEVVLTIEFDPGEHATFTITAIGTEPSISPITADYELDDPDPDDVETTITWGSASDIESITQNGNDLDRGDDYTVGDTVGGEATLTILDDYLEEELTDIGDEVVLTIDFDVGGNATFTITATGTNAGVSPQAKDYELDNRANVSTTIIWNTAEPPIVTIVDDDDYMLIKDTDYTEGDTVGGEATLTILDDYLKDELTDIGDEVVLTIEFDRGTNATFTITAVGVDPKVSPLTEEYDLDSPTNATTTITWGSAHNLTSIVDDDDYMLIKDTDYTLTSSGDTATLTILAEPYLNGKHMDIGDSVELTIDFDVGADVNFTIVPIGVQPSIFPVTADHDVIDQNDVSTTITWGSAEEVVSIVDDDEYLLEEGVHYTVTDMSDTSANLTIFSATYLADKLGSFGEKLVLTIGFDVGRDAKFTITVPEVCFIATAAYGTPMAEEIQILRDFRDEYLLTDPLGQALVGIYYRVSPPIAEFITEHPSLKPMVRAGLLPAVAISAIAVNTNPVQKAAILASLVLVSVALAVWPTRRRGRGPEYT
ncbi:MAG: X2-like carbohydrate binding domain-containing protein [Chloroflexota bacterium]